MESDRADLSVLSRGQRETPEAAPSGAIPMPRRSMVTRFAVPGALIAGTLGMLLYSGIDAITPKVDVRVVPVMVRSGGTVQSLVQAPGWVEADPYPTAVSALAEGIVKDVLVLEGDTVTAGQVVARLIDDDAKLALERAQAELGEMEAAVRTIEATFAAAQSHWDNPVELQRRVSTMEASLKEKEAELARWPSDLAGAEAKERELGAECARLTRLLKDEQASEIEQIRAREQHEVQRALVESTKARKPVLEAQVAFYQAELIAARDNLRLRIPEKRALDEAKAEVERAKAGLSRVRAARDQARLRLERMEVRSPVAGVVMARLVDPGSKIMFATDMARSAHVVRLYDPQRLQVRVDIPLAESGKIRIGASAEVIVDVLPDRTFKGTVTRVVHEADIQKNTVQVKVAIESPSRDLLPEMLARARILGETTATGPVTESIFAPSSLLRKEADGSSVVWRLDSSGRRAEKQRVTPGEQKMKGWLEVKDGLRAGDRLIADPPSNLSAGSAVRVIGEANLDEK